MKEIKLQVNTDELERANELASELRETLEKVKTLSNELTLIQEIKLDVIVQVD